MKEKLLHYWLLMISGLVGVSTASGQNWSFVKEKNEVKIYTRPMEGSGLKACKGVADINATALEVYTLVEDLNHTEWWDENLKIKKMFFYEKNKRARYYLQYNLPYPLVDRDLIADVSVRADFDNNVFKIYAKPVSGLVALKKNFVRIQDYQQSWTITANDAHSAHIEMECLLDPGGVVPDWLINMVMVNSPSNSINNIRKQLEKNNKPH
ncbi:MAG: hypothetical protein RIS29_1007 [Bacteroidota bacterium]|jgi:hypothetical protein